MNDFDAILAQINENITANGQQEITGDVLRPILQSLLSYTAEQVGDLEDLETTATGNTVDAINEVLNMITDPQQTVTGPRQVLTLSADYTLARNANTAIINIQDAAGAPVNITVPQDAGGGSFIEPVPGDFFDLFQMSSLYAPTITLGTGVEMYVEDGDFLNFVGIHSGVRLIKIAPSRWRMVRITKYGGAFRESITGGLIVSPNDVKYTNGSVGIREQNPAQALDVKGDTKVSYAHDDGTLIVIHGGDALLSDIGVPVGITKTGIMEMRNHPSYPLGESYVFTGDASVINGFVVLAGIGVRDLTPLNENEARVTAFIENLDSADKTAQMLASNAAGNYAGFSCNNGADIAAPDFWLFANDAGKAMNIYGNPFRLEMASGRLDLTSYGAPFPFVEGYDHGDGETIGAPVKALAIDEDGRVQTTDISLTKTMTLTVAQLTTLDTLPVEIIPAPGVGKFAWVESIRTLVVPGTVAYSEEEINAFHSLAFAQISIATGLDTLNQSMRFAKNTRAFTYENTNWTLGAQDNLPDGEPSDSELKLFIKYKIFEL